MYRFRSTLRRSTALAGAALAGAATVLVLASPASAHHPIVKGVAVCDTAVGDWKVTWTVSNSEDDITAKILTVELTPEGTSVTNIEPGATLPKSVDGELTGVQHVPASATGASLTVKAEWMRDKKIVEKAKGSVRFEGTCAPAPKPKPGAEFSTDCNSVVTVTLKNEGEADANFTVTGTNGFEAKKTVAPGQTDKVVVPAANSAEITVTEGPNNTLVATGKRAVPGNCGNLPVTGVKAGAAAGAALGLVGVGAVLFAVARRRRIRFTA